MCIDADTPERPTTPHYVPRKLILFSTPAQILYNKTAITPVPHLTWRRGDIFRIDTDRQTLLALDMDIPCAKVDANGNTTLSPLLYVISMAHGHATGIAEIDLKIMRSEGQLFATTDSLQKLEAAGIGRDLIQKLPQHIFGMLKTATPDHQPDNTAQNFWTENTAFRARAEDWTWIPVKEAPRRKIGPPKVLPGIVG